VKPNVIELNDLTKKYGSLEGRGKKAKQVNFRLGLYFWEKVSKLKIIFTFVHDNKSLKK